jgi:WD40 repeat protein
MTLDGHSGKVLSLAFSPDGKTLASGGDHGSLKLWDVTTGEELISFDGATDEIRLICFSPDGRTLAAYHQRPSVPGEVLLWHTLDEEPQPDVHTHIIRQNRGTGPCRYVSIKVHPEVPCANCAPMQVVVHYLYLTRPFR